MQYSPETLARAERAVRCAPFFLKLLGDMRSRRVELRAITDDRGILNGYTQRPLSELAAENQLTWLISVGLLRREVDGQGLTDSFRLTPLGRQIIERWPHQAERPASIGDNLQNAASRWLRLPDWVR